MTGFNMPPGVSPRDIPGNDAPDPSPESERVCELIESLAGCDFDQSPDALTQVEDEVARIVDELATEKARLTEDLRDANQRLSLLLRAGTRWAAFQEDDSVKDQQTDPRLRAEAQALKEQLIEILNEGGY